MNWLTHTQARLSRRLAALREAMERHPRRIAAAAGSGLLLTSVTAFGLAEYGPQPVLPPQTSLEQPLALDLSAQAQALDEQPAFVYTTATVGRSDSAASLLRRLQVTDPAQIRALAADTGLREVLRAAGTEVTARVDGLGRLQSLQAALPLPTVQGQRGQAGHALDAGSQTAWREVQLSAGADGKFTSAITEQSAAPELRMVSAVVRSSLFAAADTAGLPDAVTSQLIGVFGGEINFRRDLHPGDRFTVAYQVWRAGDRVLRVGRIVAASVSVGDQVHSAVWFDAPGHPEAAGYYDPKGGSLARAFLLSPLPYDRLTSGYGWRISPIFHKPEFHLGIDLAIPVGTPVRTVADGRVSFAGVGTGYGKYVRVEHPGGFATLYSHLSRIEVKVGEHIKQGEVVALSGNTGWSTGPHLYYQFFVHGKAVDPLTIARYAPPTPKLPQGLRETFLASTADESGLLALVPQEPDVAQAAVAAPRS